jgi:hypothetical protein
MVGWFSSRRVRRRVGFALAGLVMAATVSVSSSSAVAAPGPDEPPVVTPPASSTITTEQALARAKQTGTAVPVEAAKTATDEVTANPDGTLAVSTSVLPTRKKVNGVWRDLDATLQRNPDGSLSPAVTTNRLTLSSGGSGPMATMSSGGMSVAFTLPMALPEPTLDGDAATYPDVLPDVDLVVTADRQGGLSHVFVVHTAAAAANQALHRLSVATHNVGVAMSADAAGNITGKDRTGRPVVTAPTPLMWDSTTAAAARSTSANPDDSTVDGPGTAARIAPIGVRVTAAGIELTPDAGLLSGVDTTFPVYVDPTFTWSVVGAANNGWTTVAAQYPSTNYWKDTPDPIGRMQVGNAGSIRSRTLINFPINTSALTGATINTATLNITETYSYSCTETFVDLYAPSTTLAQSNATWNYWNGVSLGSVVDAKEVAHGYNSNCPAAGVSFDVKAEVEAAVTNNKKTQTFLLRARNESDVNGWKEFLETSPRLTVTYNHTPNTPGGMTTSPATACTAATPTTVGDGRVALYAPVSDRNGGLLGVRFHLWETSTPSPLIVNTDPNYLTYKSGTTAVAGVDVEKLRTAAGSAITQFSWKVQVTDFDKTSTWSATCNFKFDPTRTGPPEVTQPTEATIGQSVTVNVTPPTSGTAPSGYMYQLNGGPPSSVTANSGLATITVTPTRFTNTLTVTGLSPGGNVGQTAAVTFNAEQATPVPDGDLTGDGIADLLTVGWTNNLPSGLWLATGKNTGQTVAAATNIGAHGTGNERADAPSDFDGAQIITGHFTGTGLQDVLVYYPNGYPNQNGDNAGGGVLLRGNGDGSPIQAQLSGNQENIVAGSLSDGNGLNPLQLANAGNSSQSNNGYPDLIAIAGDSFGYYLSYYANQGNTLNYVAVAQLSTPTPTGGNDWNTWTIATAQTSAGTAMFLWQPSSGALHLWTNLALDPGLGTIRHTAHTLRASGWNTGAALKLQAADIDGNDTPDLWTVGANGQTTAHLTSNIAAGTGTITPQTAQNLLTADHTWLLNDATDQSVTGDNIAKDTTGSLPATGSGTAKWNTGDLFSPDVALDGATNSTLTTTGPAVTTNADFTVSVWVKANTTGGTVLSQDGTNTAGFKLWAEPTDSSWRFAMPTSNVANPTWNTAQAAAGSVQLGVWTHLTATYKQSSSLMNLYINGVDVAATTRSASWNATGAFRIGSHRTAATTIGGYLNAQVSQVLAWDQVVDPAQAASPASFYQPITQTRALDTRNGTGGTTGPLAPGSSIRLKIAGANGIPAAGVTAVAINITALSASTAGYITVWPDNTPRPTTSAVNFAANTPIANYLIAPVGANGYIRLYNANATIHLLADIAGYFSTNDTTTGTTTYGPVTPARLLDTRDGTGRPAAGTIAGGGTFSLQVTGLSGTPATAKAVAINFTVVGAASSGYLTTYADGTTRPNVSGIQFGTSTIASMAIVPIGANGKIAIYNGSGGAAHIVADAVGYFTTDPGGQKYHAINSTRMIDTRQDGGPVAADATKKVAQGNTVIANNPTLILVVTVAQPTSYGYITAYDDSGTLPPTSNINFDPGQAMAGLTLPNAGKGTIGLYNHLSSGGTTHLIVDCLGYFAN